MRRISRESYGDAKVNNSIILSITTLHFYLPISMILSPQATPRLIIAVETPSQLHDQTHFCLFTFYHPFSPQLNPKAIRSTPFIKIVYVDYVTIVYLIWCYECKRDIFKVGEGGQLEKKRRMTMIMFLKPLLVIIMRCLLVTCDSSCFSSLSILTCSKQ